MSRRRLAAVPDRAVAIVAYGLPSPDSAPLHASSLSPAPNSRSSGSIASRSRSARAPALRGGEAQRRKRAFSSDLREDEVEAGGEPQSGEIDRIEVDPVRSKIARGPRIPRVDRH